MLPFKSELIPCFQTQVRFIQENSMLILTTCSTCLYECRELCQEDSEYPVNQKFWFFLFMFAIKTCGIETNTTLSFEHGATRQTWFPCLFDIHWLNIKVHGKKRLYCSIFLSNWFVPAVWRVCFQVLVVYCCLMSRLGYAPYRHRIWSQRFFRNTYLYIALQLRSLKTKTDKNKCSKSLMFYIT